MNLFDMDESDAEENNARICGWSACILGMIFTIVTAIIYSTNVNNENKIAFIISISLFGVVFVMWIIGITGDICNYCYYRKRRNNQCLESRKRTTEFIHKILLDKYNGIRSTPHILNSDSQTIIPKYKGNPYLDNCPICLDKISLESYESLKPCGHLIHGKCLIKHLVKNRSKKYSKSEYSRCSRCPICSAEIISTHNSNSSHLSDIEIV